MVRTLIAEGLSDPNQIRIVWNGVDMPLDGYGRIRSWQSEFAGGIDNCIDRIISAHSRRGVF
jgi:hypothetical protein